MPFEAYDFQEKYLRAVFAFIGIEDVEFIAIPVGIGSIGWKAFLRLDASWWRSCAGFQTFLPSPRSGEVRPIADVCTRFPAAPKPLKSRCSRYGTKFPIIEEPNRDVVLVMRGCSRIAVPMRPDT
jgi:hypothetical protein